MPLSSPEVANVDAMGRTQTQATAVWVGFWRAYFYFYAEGP